MSTINLKYHTPASHTALRVTLEKMDITWRFAVEWSWSKVSLFGQTRVSLKSKGNHYALSYLFGVELRDLIWIWVDVYLYIHVTHNDINNQKFNLKDVAKVTSLSLGCISHANTNNIPTTSSWNDEFYWIYQQIDGILLGFSHTFSRHT